MSAPARRGLALTDQPHAPSAHHSAIHGPDGTATVNCASLPALVLQAALWGEPDPVLDAIDAGSFTPDLFTGTNAVVAQAIYDVVLAGTVPTPDAVLRHLLDTGTPAEVAMPAVGMADAFEAAGYRCDGFDYWLARMAEEAARERLRAELLRLGTALETAGGPARVAARLTGVAA